MIDVTGRRQLLLSTAVNAAVLALLDSSLPMKFLPAAVTCVPIGDRVLVNPLPAERQVSADRGRGEIQAGECGDMVVDGLCSLGSR